MAHQSEQCNPLKVVKIKINNEKDLKNINSSNSAVWLFILPYDSSHKEIKISKRFLDSFEQFISQTGKDSIICFLSSIQTSAKLLLNLQKRLYYKLWITVKNEKPYIKKHGLSENHCTLLILSKYKENIKHTKTRIAYTYCPACDKTTKDYGGKKHTYHEYGTLMSDVWRDISVSVNSFPSSVVDRLKDVFGLLPYKDLFVIDISKLLEYKIENSTKMENNIAKANILDGRFHNVLLNGDCLEILKSIPSNSIDYCFADPPYNLKKKYDNWNDGLEINEYFKWCDNWLYELGRIIKPGCTVSVLNIPQFAVRHYSYLRNYLHFQNWITWEGLSLPVRMIMPSNYTILCFSKGKPRALPLNNNDALLTFKETYCFRENCIRKRENDKEPITDLWWDIHRLKHNARRVDHPCQLPPLLMKRLISLFTNEGEIVLDPFNGVGTTTLSAEEINRKYIGIELSNYYHSIAKQRHSELAIGLSPFRKNGSAPKTKNSLVPRLKKQKYEVPKKVLQLEVKNISKIIGKLPTREDVKKYSKYPMHMYEDYFISWGEVCAAARTTGMTENRKRKEKVTKRQNQLELFS